MQRLKVNLGIKVSSVLPNYITLLCGIILITFVTEKMYLEYLIPFCSLNYFLIIILFFLILFLNTLVI